MKRDKSICLIFDPAKSLDKVNLMNTLAQACQVLHSDPEIGRLSVHVLGAGRGGKTAKHMFDFKIK